MVAFPHLISPTFLPPGQPPPHCSPAAAQLPSCGTSLPLGMELALQAPWEGGRRLLRVHLAQGHGLSRTSTVPCPTAHIVLQLLPPPGAPSMGRTYPRHLLCPGACASRKGQSRRRAPRRALPQHKTCLTETRCPVGALKQARGFCGSE